MCLSAWHTSVPEDYNFPRSSDVTTSVHLGEEFPACKYVNYYERRELKLTLSVENIAYLHMFNRHLAKKRVLSTSCFNSFFEDPYGMPGSAQFFEYARDLLESVP